MAKRFTDTNIWKNQRWFKKMSPTYKLAFNYIKDQCDHAGLWKIDCIDLMEDLGIEEFDFDDFIDKCNTEYDKTRGAKVKRIRVLLYKKEVLWLTGFIQFQYENKSREINIDAAPVRTALMALKSYDFLDAAIRNGYIRFRKELMNKYTFIPDNYVTLMEHLSEPKKPLQKSK